MILYHFRSKAYQIHFAAGFDKGRTCRAYTHWIQDILRLHMAYVRSRPKQTELGNTECHQIRPHRMEIDHRDSRNRVRQIV